jgi:hypothetical protein
MQSDSALHPNGGEPIGWPRWGAISRRRPRTALRLSDLRVQIWPIVEQILHDFRYRTVYFPIDREWMERQICLVNQVLLRFFPRSLH